MDPRCLQLGWVVVALAYWVKWWSNRLGNCQITDFFTIISQPFPLPFLNRQKPKVDTYLWALQLELEGNLILPACLTTV